MQTTNGLFSWQPSDFVKGLFMAVLTTLLTGLYTILSAGAFPTWEQFKPYLISSVSAGVAYILKNFISNNQGQVLKKDVPVKVVPADSIVLPPEDNKK